MTERFLRQSFLGPDSEAVLTALQVAIVGLGGGGSHIAQQLAHLGVGHFLLMDPDRIDGSNSNRLIGGTESDVRRAALKTYIARRQIRRINPAAKVIAIPTIWQMRAELLSGSDIIFGSLDTFIGRVELEASARRYHIPYLDLGMDVFSSIRGFSISGQVALSLPGQPCLRCMGVIQDKWLQEEAANYGAAGGRPQVVWPNGLLASLAVGLAVQLVSPWHSDPPALLLEYDGNTNELVHGSVLDYQPPRCPHFSALNSVGDPWFHI